MRPQLGRKVAKVVCHLLDVPLRDVEVD